MERSVGAPRTQEEESGREEEEEEEEKGRERTGVWRKGSLTMGQPP